MLKERYSLDLIITTAIVPKRKIIRQDIFNLSVNVGNDSLDIRSNVANIDIHRAVSPCDSFAVCCKLTLLMLLYYWKNEGDCSYLQKIGKNH